MALPEPTSSTSRVMLVLRVLAGVVAGISAIVFLFAVWMVVSSRTGLDDRDVHGYGLIFGTVFAVVAGLVTTVALPLAVSPRRRTRTAGVSLAVFAAIIVLLVITVVTA
ncbi:MAG TPA: hypothetical protein VNJ54_06025 [Plantibacter sp.]|uniref:hypothetical protein n=1 Tax=unclassified Plantibacter TaxID=2624265 RepID=UPI002BA4A9B6|nr:hypothetical protein [Plantibacter sp.]